MNLRYEKQASCPSDQLLSAYKTKELTGEEHDAVMFHLLFCDACQEVLQQLPADTKAAIAAAESSGSALDGETSISAELAQAIEKFREREQRRRKAPVKTLEQIEQEGGLKVGQIWRTRFDGIIVPGRETEQSFSVTGLNSTPHLVVIIEAEGGTGTPRGKYYEIRVAPISGELQYAGNGDCIIGEEDSPLGYPFMVELWSAQPMLRENLDCCLGVFDVVQHKTIVDMLQQQQKEIQRKGENPLSLEETVMKGLYHNPIMRFRAHEYEETAYLREPVEALHQLLSGEVSGEKSIADVRLALTEEEDIATRPVVEITPARRQSQRPSKDVRGGARRYPVAPENRELRVAAQQQSEPGWPFDFEVLAEGTSSPVRLRFTWLGFDLVVEHVYQPEAHDVVVRLERTNQEISLSPGAKDSLGPLEEFRLTSESSAEEINDALVSTGITVRKQ